jgi:hypothetical protein
LPSTSVGSNAWMPSLCSVGARLSSTGLLDDLLEDVPHLGIHLVDVPLGRPGVLDDLPLDEWLMMNGEELERHRL